MIKLIHGDCRAFPIPVFDTLITDPPYSAHVHEQMASCAQRGASKGVRQRSAGFAHLSPELREHIAKAAGAARRWSLIYCDLQGMNAWERALARHIRTIPIVADGEAITGGGVVGGLPWIRWSSPQQSGDRPPSGCEMLVIGHAPGSMTWGGPGNLTYLDHKCERGDQKHPTAKPLDQALDLVAWFSNPGEIVFDPCSGGGTTGLACALLGRNFIGYEIDEGFAAMAHRRIRMATDEFVLSKRDEERWNRFCIKCSLHPTEDRFKPLRFRKGLVVR